MKTTDQQARKLCRHTVVFTQAVDARAAAMAMQGLTTKAIARELGISEAMAQYRISKAQNSLRTRFRGDYRNGNGVLALRMRQATEKMALAYVRLRIAPKFIPYAAQGVRRLTQ